MSSGDLNVEELVQNLVYASPRREDKINALLCVLVLRTLRNCRQRVVSDDELAKMRRRLKKLIISTGDPQGVLVIITRTNLSDIVTTISEELHCRFGSSENLIKVAMKRDKEFDEALILALADQLEVVKLDVSSQDPESNSPANLGTRPVGDVSVIFCSLALRNVLNIPYEIYRSLPSDVRKKIYVRLSGLMIYQKRKNDPVDLQSENLKRIAAIIAKDIHEAFGTIQKLFNVALMSGHSFDVLFLDYLVCRLHIKPKRQNPLTRMVGRLDRGLEKISRWFYQFRTSRYGAIRL